MMFANGTLRWCNLQFKITLRRFSYYPCCQVSKSGVAKPELTLLGVVILVECFLRRKMTPILNETPERAYRESEQLFKGEERFDRS